MVKKTTSRKVKRTKSRRTPSRKVKRTKSRSTTPRKVKRTKSRSSKRRKRRSTTKKIMKGGVDYYKVPPIDGAEADKFDILLLDLLEDDEYVTVYEKTGTGDNATNYSAVNLGKDSEYNKDTMTESVAINSLKFPPHVGNYSNCNTYILNGERHGTKIKKCIGETEYYTIKQYLNTNTEATYTEILDPNKITTININSPSLTMHDSYQWRRWTFFNEGRDRALDYTFGINTKTQKITA